MTDKPRMNNIVTIVPEALDTYSECMTLIAEAYKWAGDPTNCTSPELDLQQEWDKHHKLVHEMERSFLSNWAHLTCQPQAFDGPLTISRDGFCSFFWIYTNHNPGGKPYHGGLIFHKNHSIKDEDVTIGTFSIHT